MMSEWSDDFESIVSAVITRFFAQNSRPAPSSAELGRFAAQMWRVIITRGLPPPLRENECGMPGGMAEQECAPIVAQVMAGLDEPLLADAARQVIKACFYPEFKTCRDSFREVSRDGTCRRQQLERVRGRISGTHCVDCPHWVALAPAAHAQYLRTEWRASLPIFEDYRCTFLPEDFRALRLWLHDAARHMPHAI